VKNTSENTRKPVYATIAAGDTLSRFRTTGLDWNPDKHVSIVKEVVPQVTFIVLGSAGG